MDSNSFQRPATIVVDLYEVDRRLRELGVSRGPLIEAVLEGDLQRRLNNTPDDFYATPGYVGWARTLRVMRAQLGIEHGWHTSDFLQIPVSYNPVETIAIAVSSGDERTGLAGDDPSTNAKGPQTAAAVTKSSQGEFEFDEDGVELWYLLTYVSEDGVMVELSRPSFMDDRNNISSWYERIILGRVDPDGAPVGVQPPVVSTDITIDVPRKTA